MKVPESSVLKACLDLLAAERIWHRRQNTGSMRVPATEVNRARFVQFNLAGHPDILCTPWLMTSVGDDIDFQSGEVTKSGMAVWPAILWIETKSDCGKQSDEQRAFQEDAERHGHHYLLVNNVDVLINHLKKYRRVTHGN